MIKSFRYLLKEGVRNIWSNRTMSLASVGVLVSCLLLTGAAVLFSMNISAAMKTIEGTNSVKIYMQQGQPVLTSVKVGQEIKKLDNIKSCKFIPKDQAIENVMGMLGEKDANLLAGMTGKDNPLPDAYQVSFQDLSKYKNTVAQIQKIQGVESSERLLRHRRETDKARPYDYDGRVLDHPSVEPRFSVYHFQYDPRDHVLAAAGDQHYEIGRRDELVHPGAVYCGRRHHRADFRRVCQSDAAAALRQADRNA